MYETYVNLRGGTGFVEVYAKTLGRHLIGKKRYIARVFTKLVLHPQATIGEHRHKIRTEIYLTFNKNIRFNNNSKWHLINICRGRHKHSAQNIGDEKATIYAFKF